MKTSLQGHTHFIIHNISHLYPSISRFLLKTKEYTIGIDETAKFLLFQSELELIDIHRLKNPVTL
jgi:hypothetical protein